jgi:adenylosuccinate synthase
MSDLPDAAREYIRFIEEHTVTPVAMIGVGPGREQVIWTEAGQASVIGPGANGAGPRSS